MLKPEFSEQNTCHTAGDTVILNCGFNFIAGCSWQKNRQPTKLTGRYKFINKNKSNIEGQTDCSIKISKLRKHDSGIWQCGTLSNSTSEGTRNNKDVVVMMCQSTSGMEKQYGKKNKFLWFEIQDYINEFQGHLATNIEEQDLTKSRWMI